MIRVAGLAVLVVALALSLAGRASAQVGHRVANLVVPGSAQNEPRKVTVHLWYPADAAAYNAAPKTTYTSLLNGRTQLPAGWDPLSWRIDAELAHETSTLAAGGPLPVIVFSHGSVNDPIDYAWTLEELARNGFIVAAPYHTNNTQDDVRIDAINAAGGSIACDDGRPGPCSRTDNARSVQDRVRDVSAIIDSLPAWFGARADLSKIGALGHSRGTITVLAAAAGSTAWGFAAEPRVRAIMGMAIGARTLRDPLDLSRVTVPVQLVAGAKDRNTAPAISQETIPLLGTKDKQLLIVPEAVHRSFDSTYCAQLQAAGAIAQGNPRALVDALSVPLIASSAPAGISGRAVYYCAERFFTTPVDIRPLVMGTPGSEFPPQINENCVTTAIPCTGLDTEAVKVQMVALATEFFSAKLARAAGGGVSGTVPATLALSLGAPASFGAFVPGVGKEYTATTTANVVSTAGDATLTAADPGRLMNGAFSLPQPVRIEFSKSSWSAPVSNDSVTITFKQAIGANDALRTGSYSKTVTFTLSTTSP